jgi:exodeoxyribonuclease V beta subunit
VKDYDPERDLGVVYYLFVRGMKEGGRDTGVFATKPPVGLVEGLSTLFGTPDKGR